MLPKPEKVKKKDKDTQVGQQLDLLTPIQDEQKAKKNRFWVVIILLSTIGLSLGFWVYRSFKTTPFFLSSPRLSLTLPNRGQSTVPDLDKIVDSVIASDPNSWSIFVQTLSPDSSSFRWGRLTDPLFSTNSQAAIIAGLQQSSPQSTSAMLSRLPQGIEIRENIEDTQDFYQLNSLITVPGKEIILLFKITGSADIETSKNLIPTLSESIYWHLMSLD